MVVHSKSLSFILAIFASSIVCSCQSYEEPLPKYTEEELELIELNQWIYSTMKLDYLWEDQMPDSSNCDYLLPAFGFFNSLLAKQDRFSYAEGNSNGRTTTQESYFGFEYQRVKDENGQEYLSVLYTASEQAKETGIERGDLLRPIQINVNTATLEFMQISNTQILPDNKRGIVTLSAESRAERPSVLFDDIYFVNGIKVGYICYLGYQNITELAPSIQKMSEAGVDEFILDLRYNPGGYVHTCKYLCNSIVPAYGYGRIYQRTRYNRRRSALNFQETGDSSLVNRFVDPSMFGKEYGTNSYTLDLNRVFFLVSKYSASASEANIVCLRPYMDEIVIGETTVGKGQGSWGINDGVHCLTLHPITMNYYNENDETVPYEGLEPDILVTDGYSVPKAKIGDPEEPLLNTALQIIAGVFKNPQANSLARSTPALEPVGLPSFVPSYLP